MTKYQLIQLSDQSIIVNNEESKIIDTVNLIDFKKIIAGTEGLPKIDYNSLSKEDQEKIGYIDIESRIRPAINYWNTFIGEKQQGIVEGIQCYFDINNINPLINT